jgi:4-diphosphocytidyl-2-C-methyl-D-erythritol kinase
VTGLLLARMSGSGATCFGLFADAAAAQLAAEQIAQTQPAWWVRAGRLIRGREELVEF